MRSKCFHCVNCYRGQLIPAAMIEKISKGASEAMLLVYIYSWDKCTRVWRDRRGGLERVVSN